MSNLSMYNKNRKRNIEHLQRRYGNDNEILHSEHQEDSFQATCLWRESRRYNNMDTPLRKKEFKA